MIKNVSKRRRHMVLTAYILTVKAAIQTVGQFIRFVRPLLSPNCDRVYFAQFQKLLLLFRLFVSKYIHLTRYRQITETKKRGYSTTERLQKIKSTIPASLVITTKRGDFERLPWEDDIVWKDCLSNIAKKTSWKSRFTE